MHWLFRTSTLVVVSVALTVVAAGLVFWPFGSGARADRAVPRPVPAGDQEVAFLSAATNAGWERFVAAVRRLRDERPDLGVQVAADGNAFPGQTTAVAGFAVPAGGSRARLWFRWYKMTGDPGTGEWVRALAGRDPPPLAVIGGGSSDRARDLALELEKLLELPTAAPLLLLTTAT